MRTLVFLFLIGSMANSAFGATVLVSSSSLGPGAEHRHYTTADPNHIHLLIMDRNQLDLSLRMGWPYGVRGFPARQQLTSMVTYYETPSFDVVGAVNASLSSTVSGQHQTITGVAGSSNNFIAKPNGDRQNIAFLDSRAGLFLSNLNWNNSVGNESRVTFANGTRLLINNLNFTRLAEELVVYMPVWGASTQTSSAGTEVVLTNVSYPARADKEVSGIISQVVSSGQNTPIPAGGMVLSAHGAKAAALLANAVVGQRVSVFLDHNNQNFNNAQMWINGPGALIVNGVNQSPTWGGSGISSIQPSSRNPRTAIGYSNTHWFLMTVDGRNSGVSEGMNFDEMAAFILDTVASITGTAGLNAINVDGGGSTTMVVNGALVNSPSGPPVGLQRNLPNAIMLVRQPSEVQPSGTLSDSFPSSGLRQLAWDDKRTYNGIVPFSPAAPGGDGYVMSVSSAETSGGIETTHVGLLAHTDYRVKSHVYCEYRSTLPTGNSETYGIFARDNGDFAFTTSAFLGGDCYAMTYDARSGRLRCGKTVNGSITDFLATVKNIRASGWHQFEILCVGSSISYYLDGVLQVAVTDTTRANGFAGVGYNETLTDNALIHGTRVDNFEFSTVSDSSRVGEWSLY